MTSTDPTALAAAPYRTPAPLSVRVAIYAWQRPPVDLPGAATTALADLPDHGLVVDVGCGPGRYLHRLRQARPDLRCLAVDISASMLAAIDDRRVLRAVGSADTLPLPAHAVDGALAMHMLYHLPDPQAGLAELRRVVRPGGWLVASTNDDLPDGLWRVFRDSGLPRRSISARWPLTDAATAIRAAGFRDIHEQIYDYVLDIPTTQPVLDYLDSCRTHFPALPDQAWTDIRATVTAAVAAQIQRHGTFHRTGRVGLVTARQTRTRPASIPARTIPEPAEPVELQVIRRHPPLPDVGALVDVSPASGDQRSLGRPSCPLPGTGSPVQPVGSV